MNKKLPFNIITTNYGSQYHNFLFGLILDEAYLKKYIFNNYVPVLVKHFFDSHGDFYNEGIYGYNNSLIRQLILRGPIDNLHEVIQNYIDNSIYVIINVNEEFLPHRRAYKNYYFRHDLMIYGYDDENNSYVTAGFDENMIFCEKSYSFDTIENAYRKMQNEWDYELFAFRICDKYPDITVNKEQIYAELNDYINAENINDKKHKEIINCSNKQFFINYSYKRFYGIDIYEYLLQRVQGSKKLFRNTPDNDRLGINDLRTINVMIAHAEILKKIFIELLEIRDINIWEKMIDELNYLKILVIQYMENKETKYKKSIIKHIKRIKSIQIEFFEGTVFPIMAN